MTAQQKRKLKAEMISLMITDIEAIRELAVRQGKLSQSGHTKRAAKALIKLCDDALQYEDGINVESFKKITRLCYRLFV